MLRRIYPCQYSNFFAKRVSNPGGFTLIEIMVVITVIAILSGVVLFNVNFNSEKRHVQTTANQLQQLAQVAADEALQLNRLLGIELFTDGYRFLEWVEPEHANFAKASDQTQNNGSDLQENSHLSGSVSVDAPLPESGYWDLLRGDKFLKEQRFKQNDDISVELQIAGSRIELLPMDTAIRVKDNQSNDPQKKPAYQPHLIFSPSGEAEDFVLTIAAKNERDYQYVLRADVLGKLSLQVPGKEQE